MTRGVAGGIFLGVFLFTGGAPATAFNLLEDGQPYFGLSSHIVSMAAANIQANRAFTVAPFIDESAEVNTDIGWGLTGAVGWLYDDNWRIEAELGHRQLTLSEVTSPGNRSEARGDWGLSTFFLNVAKDFRGNSVITPYIGVGAGVMLHQFSLNAFVPPNQSLTAQSLTEKFDITPAYQFMAGVNLEVAEDFDIVMGYRFVGTLEPDYDILTFDRLDIHSFEVGFKYYFEDYMN
ncbi:MAG: outer membrane protein [Nitrospinaceae bacterium]